MGNNRYAKSEDIEMVLSDYGYDFEDEDLDIPAPTLRKDAEARIRELFAAEENSIVHAAKQFVDAVECVTWAETDADCELTVLRGADWVNLEKAVQGE